MNEEKFYALLGEFLYALALSDGLIQEAEIKELEKLVKEELFDKHGKREIIFTKLRFFNCLNRHISKEEAANAFIEYCSLHAAKITKYQKQVSRKLIHGVESAYKGISGTEETMVQRLEDIFGKRISHQ